MKTSMLALSLSVASGLAWSNEGHHDAEHGAGGSQAIVVESVTKE